MSIALDATDLINVSKVIARKHVADDGRHGTVTGWEPMAYANGYGSVVEDIRLYLIGTGKTESELSSFLKEADKIEREVNRQYRGMQIKTRAVTYSASSHK